MWYITVVIIDINIIVIDILALMHRFGHILGLQGETKVRTSKLWYHSAIVIAELVLLSLQQETLPNYCAPSWPFWKFKYSFSIHFAWCIRCEKVKKAQFHVFFLDIRARGIWNRILVWSFTFHKKWVPF